MKAAMTHAPLYTIVLLLGNSKFPVLGFAHRGAVLGGSQRIVRCTSSDVTVLQQKETPKDDGVEWTSDFDDWIGGGDKVDPVPSMRSREAPAEKGYKIPSFIINNNNDTRRNENEPDEESLKLTQLFAQQIQKVNILDKTAIRTRKFSLGQDLTLADYVGDLGFDEVTDWEYYYRSDDPYSNERKVVQPNPFDKSQPKRTRVSSGSVVRIFRGEFVGALGGLLSSQGLDRRILVKEFTGTMALKLASSELAALATLQSSISDNDWTLAAAARSVQARQDHMNVAKLVKLLQPKPYLGILGEVNLAEMEGEMEPNEFYRALGVPPPKPDAVWLVYEYAGLSTIQTYAQPALIRLSKLPMKRGFFGNPVPPDPLPSWEARARYVVQGMVKGAIAALADLHEQGLVHRSLGRTSIILSSKTQEKREAISVYATQFSNLSVKFADFGFAIPSTRVTKEDPDFVARARTFGLFLKAGQEANLQAVNFAMAEDMHALGFVILALLLTSLADIENVDDPLPPTDEDSLQRLLGEIFDKDVKEQFREYVMNEKAWSKLVSLLDEKNGAGWDVLDSLLNAREKAAAAKAQESLISVRGLLSNPFFS